MIEIHLNFELTSVENMIAIIDKISEKYPKAKIIVDKAIPRLEKYER